jgi:hypothetical protein
MKDVMLEFVVNRMELALSNCCYNLCRIPVANILS